MYMREKVFFGLSYKNDLVNVPIPKLYNVHAFTIKYINQYEKIRTKKSNHNYKAE